jgi:hypothetical protein
MDLNNLGLLEGVMNNRPDYWTGDSTIGFVPPDVELEYGKISEKEKNRILSASRPKRSFLRLTSELWSTEEKSSCCEWHENFDRIWMKDNNRFDDWEESGFYMARVRMENVPILLTRNEEQELQDIPKKHPTQDNIPPRPNDLEIEKLSRMEYLIHNSHYLFCKGSQGYIMSNVKSVSNGDDFYSGNSKKADTIFPKVELTQNNTGCMPTGDSSKYEYYDQTLDRIALETERSATCSIDDTLNQRRTEQIDGTTYQCRLTKTDTSEFGGFELFDAEIDYWVPVWWKVKE